MDVFTRSLFVRVVERAAVKNVSNSSSFGANCTLASKLDADTSIPEILGINIAVWLVR